MKICIVRPILSKLRNIHAANFLIMHCFIGDITQWMWLCIVLLYCRVIILYHMILLSKLSLLKLVNSFNIIHQKHIKTRQNRCIIDDNCWQWPWHEKDDVRQQQICVLLHSSPLTKCIQVRNKPFNWHVYTEFRHPRILSLIWHCESCFGNMMEATQWRTYCLLGKQRKTTF